MEHITHGALHLAIQITGSRDVAMDILQDAVIKALEVKNAPKPSEQGYKAWFYRVVHNQSIDWLRREKRLVNDDCLQEVAADDPGPEARLESEHRKILLHKALSHLSSEHREIICLKDFHYFSYAEIAEIKCIEKGTVMSRLHRARLALKDQLFELKLIPGDA